ncbi:MAG TPA: PhnD/SsuA/transferrin family substrate-binding protein [Vicinamibacterales bacterium]|jgi:signal transduction histidine kinase/ActR/RegA family two-component response regulator|nr:PhnD/SsuA/transferrin family substrate-binding protein [Vicinamibacterales bacterium]
MLLRCAAVACLCCLPGLAAAQERPLRIGNVTAQFGVPPPNFAPLTDYLSTYLDGRRFEVVPLNSIEQMLEVVDAGRVDFVIASPVALVTLTTRHRVRPIATVTQMAGDRLSPFLAGAVFVKSGRQDLQLLEDARGKRVLALSRLALGGWLAPVREWQKRGLAETDFGSLQFDFSYQEVAAKVCTGAADIGVLPANRFHDLRNSCPGGFRVLGSPQGRAGSFPIATSTPLYPEAGFAAVSDLDEDVVTRVTVALLAIDAGSPAARVVGVSGFTAPLSYTPVQQLMQELRVGPYESFGRLTFTQAVRQHAGKVLIGMIAFLSVLLLAFVRSQRLNVQLARSIEQQRQAEHQRLQLESQLQQSRRLESIGRVAGGVAHDFNNLLTVINGYSQILLMGPLTPDSREEIEQINKAGRRAAELTNQLLTFSRRQIIDVVPLDLNTVIHDAEPLLRRLAGEDVQLVVTPAPQLARTDGDVSQTTQVLMNLVVNARDAMPTGGRIDLATGNITVRGADGHPPELSPGQYVVLTVSDTGCGMSAETRQHIFEPFFSTKGEAGTGLGLSTVYGIVRQRQGAIDVWSEPGLGSRFQVYLPQAAHRPDAEPAGAPVAAHTEAPAGDRRILVVEDQDEVRGFATEVLRATGYQVLEASSGDEAMRLFEAQSEPIDLLLTDVVLHGMNGREVAEQFVRVFPAASVLFTSGYPDDVTAQKGVPRGSVAFLPKPYSPEALTSRVAELLNSATV